jgi:hypothetical protein
MTCTTCVVTDRAPQPCTHQPAVGPAAPICDGCGGPRPDGLCDDCVTCDRCGDSIPQEYTGTTVRGSTICDDCISRFYWHCERCDGWNRDGLDCGNRCDDDDAWDVLHDYSFRPRPVFHGTGPLFIGPEIEVEAPAHDLLRSTTIACSQLGELGYLKEDGSLRHGFEIVTHPMSYAWAMQHFPWQMLTDLQAAGCRTPENTGIHVHVSRTAFDGPSHTYRWMKFIYRNEHEVTTLARRSSPQYAPFTAYDRRAVKHYAKGAFGDRYRAINTNNTDTFELRIFASSLLPAQVKAAFGFAAASVEYTRELTVAQIAGSGGWTWPAFVSWLAERPAYAPLTRELQVLSCVC